MSKMNLLRLLICLLFLACSIFAIAAQEEDKKAAETPTAKSTTGSAPAAVGPMHPYRVDFSISEMENGKKINSRHYSMLSNAGSWNQVKIGTRVPVSNSQIPLQYLDVGTSINCKLIESGDELAIDVHSDFSNFTTPEEQHNSQPIVRQMNISGNTVVASGKPIIIGTVDDPNSDREFQLEATVTKLK